jgi:hypothetical protein
MAATDRAGSVIESLVSSDEAILALRHVEHADGGSKLVRP